MPSGEELNNLVYIILDYVPNGIFYDAIEAAGGLGEQRARYFMEQLIDVISYLHGQGVVHRDLKLENILVDENLNLIITDFGFATSQNISKLKSYKGTYTYMAPEIRNGRTYDGR